MSWSNLSVRRRFLQRLFWHQPGFALLRRYTALRRQLDYVLLNYSLDSETNGERWLIGQLPPAPLVVDVGFNAGDYTREVLAQRPGARVHAFDPSRFAAQSFAGGFAGAGRVTFVPQALADVAGEAVFHDYGSMNNSLANRSDQGAAQAEYRVPITTLDDYCREQGIARIDLLKIDAEGFDANVLEGARGLLERGAIDLFMFEFADGWAANGRFYHEVQKFLQGKPYTLTRLFNGFLCPVVRNPDYPSYGLGFMSVGVSRRRQAENPLTLRPVGI